MKRIYQITHDLATLYPRRAAAQNRIAIAERVMARIALELTPADGWEGKNEDQRRQNRDRVLAGNELYCLYSNGLESDRAELNVIEGEIAALEAERRGLELFARIRLTEMLTGETADLDQIIDQMIQEPPLTDKEAQNLTEALKEVKLKAEAVGL